MSRSRHGFTIVELIIVIVVIAILAAISIVAYTGIQNRAYNTKVISGATQYQKALYSYKSINNSYPALTGCLGRNYPNNACRSNSADGTTPPNHWVVNSSLDTALSEFIPSKPEVGTELINIVVVNEYRGGLVYIHNDGTYGHRLTYYLKGNSANCGLRVTAQSNEGPLTQCNISLP